MGATTAWTGSWADGDRYEAYVGRWSRPVARQFVAGLAVPAAGTGAGAGAGTPVAAPLPRTGPSPALALAALVLLALAVPTGRLVRRQRRS